MIWKKSLRMMCSNRWPRPDVLPLNSPVLQRQAGYRQVLRAWLLLDLAAKLSWTGGDDVYAGGKRDAAAAV